MYLISRSITADKLFSNPKAEIINLVISLPRMYDQSIFNNSIKHSRFKPLQHVSVISFYLEVLSLNGSSSRRKKILGYLHAFAATLRWSTNIFGFTDLVNHYPSLRLRTVHRTYVNTAHLLFY